MYQETAGILKVKNTLANSMYHVTKFSILFKFAIGPYFYFYLAQQPPMGQGLPIHEVSRSHTTTHHSQYVSCGRVISPTQKPLPDNTQQTQQTEIHVPDGIRTHNFSRQEAADLRLTPRGHWDRLNRPIYIYRGNISYYLCNRFNE